MNKYSKPTAVAILMLVFVTWFSQNIKSDLSLIFQKDLHAHDESSNSVVAANLKRQFFPPMVRVNPLTNEQGNWMEGPYWQHIPPMFAYVPYVFFKIDGQVTIEVKRLAYAFITLLTGLLFILFVYRYKESLLAAIAALIAAIFWINTPFTHELITGYAFGVSDIMLAFTSVLAFGGLLHYWQHRNKIILVAFLVALPIMAKNLLGAIPAAVFLALLFWENKKFGKKFWTGICGLAAVLALYYLPLLIASPGTFKNEILVPLLHLGGSYEGWGRPWHYYLTNYLPQRYLFGWTWVYYLGLIFAVGYNVIYIRLIKKHKIRTSIAISLGWFLANLIVISIVNSKIPNFIYQSYLLSLYAMIYSIFVLMEQIRPEFIALLEKANFSRMILVPILLLVLFATGYQTIRLRQEFKFHRAQAYHYNTEHEKFYEVGEWMRKFGLNDRDLTVVRVSDNDCWFRYYVLFLTGAESKTLTELSFNLPGGELLKQKYDRIFMVANKTDSLPANLPAYSKFSISNYTILQFNIGKIQPSQAAEIISSFVQSHQKDIEQDIIRIKADKTSCQWLVPDAILNAP